MWSSSLFWDKKNQKENPEIHFMQLSIADATLHRGAFCQFPFRGFTNMTVINSLERKLAKHTSVHCKENEKTSPKGFSASKCNVRNWMISKSKDFFEKLLGNFLDLLGEFF